MRYAIDRYSIGVETEVSADDFDGQRYIPGKLTRFYCPECGEIVYFRSKGGHKPNLFYHQTRTEKSPECDKRVDGLSSLSLSQRVGLPMYLTGILSSHYQLNIGFPALGAEMLKKASFAECKVEISAGKRQRTVLVNPTNFIGDSTTYIPVDFIPEHGNNYNITISSEKSVFGLQRKWADYADGFDKDGAVFINEETGGKKVRRGDTISTNRSYYVVTKHRMPAYTEIQSREIGKFKLGDDSFRIFETKIIASVENETRFTVLCNYFQEHFGVWLLESQPELIPIWPPVVQQDYFIPVKSGTPVICGVSSGNADPSVFQFSDYGVKRNEVFHGEGNVSTVDLIIGERPVTLSVDRKYVGREVTFLSKEIRKKSFDNQIELISATGAIPWEDVSQKILSDSFTFLSNSKMEL